MTSLKSLFGCIGVDTSSDVSLKKRMFGLQGMNVPVGKVSTLEKVADFRSQHVNFNVIKVGFDVLADQQLGLDMLDFAIARAHSIFRAAGLGVGRVTHYTVLSAEAGGLDDIANQDEADLLSDRFTIPDEGIDVFVVRNISANFLGISPVPGSCSKPSGSDGLLAGEIGDPIPRSFDGFARTFCHEIGHFLGLSHTHGSGPCPSSHALRNNLMAQTRCAISMRDSVELNADQSQTINGHCSIQPACP